MPRLRRCTATFSTAYRTKVELPRPGTCFASQFLIDAVHTTLRSTTATLVTGPFRRIIVGLAFFLATCLVAVVGYMIAGWNAMDAVYMVIITIFGVGYGEVHPIESTGLRVFTIGVIVAGYAAAIYTVGGCIQMITEGEINRALGARRMTKGIEKLVGHCIICGYGRIGRILAKELSAADMSFVVVDQEAEKIIEAESHGFYVVHGSATEEETVERAGARRARILATVLPDDAANVFITLTARELNPELEVIARAENPASEKKLLQSGASKVVLPAAIGAVRLAHMITRPGAEAILEDLSSRADLLNELGQIGLHVNELRVAGNSPLIGKTVADIEIRGNHGFLIVAVRKKDGSTVLNPASDLALQHDDVVIVLGHSDDLPQLAERYVLRKQIVYRGARTA